MTGERLFRIGLFLLPSSACWGALFAASFRGSQGRAQPIWRDRSRQPLLLAAVLMLIGALQAGPGSWPGRAWAIGCPDLPRALQPYVLTELQRRDAAWMLGWHRQC